MLLLSLLLIPVLGIYLIFSTTSYRSTSHIITYNDFVNEYTNNNIYYKKIALVSSIINFIISLIIYISFDFSSNQFQFVSSLCDMGGDYSLFLGVDGLSIYFVVRPLINITEPGQLGPTTGLLLCKPTNLPKNERTWGLEHVSKVLKEVKYILLRGKVHLTHALTILLSQD